MIGVVKNVNIGAVRANKHACSPAFSSNPLKTQPARDYKSYLDSANSGNLFASNVSAISFSGGYNFALKKISGLPCAYCGKEVVSYDTIDEVQELKGSELTDRLEVFLRQNPKDKDSIKGQAYNEFKRIVLANPKLNGADILPIVYVESRDKVIAKQLAVYSSVQRLAKKLPNDRISRYINTVKDQDVSLNKNISMDKLTEFLKQDTHIQYRRQVMRRFDEIADSYSRKKDRATVAQIRNELMKLPNSKNDKDAYLVKFISGSIRKTESVKNPYVPLESGAAALFYSVILNPYLASAEHIKPHSHNGADDSSNFLITHAHCNSKRGNEDWILYATEHPEIFDNVIDNIVAIVSDPSLCYEVDDPDFDLPEHITDIINQLRIETSRHEIKRGNKKVEVFLEELNALEALVTEPMTRIHNKKKYSKPA